MFGGKSAPFRAVLVALAVAAAGLLAGCVAQIDESSEDENTSQEPLDGIILHDPTVDDDGEVDDTDDPTDPSPNPWKPDVGRKVDPSPNPWNDPRSSGLSTSAPSGSSSDNDGHHH